MLGMAALFIVNACQKPMPDPVLTLSQTTVSVSADGGPASVAFRVSNPRDGAEVSLKIDENNWVKDLEVVDENINFNVDPNKTMQQRSVDVTVSYSGAADQSFSIVQAGMAADYDTELTGFYGVFYENYGVNGEDNYLILLSDKAVSGGSMQLGSTNYILDFYVASGSTSGRELTAGTYTLGVSQETKPMTIGMDDSLYMKYSEDGSATQLSFTNGYVEVSLEGDIYTIDGVLTDNEGKVHHFVYTGTGFPELPESIEVDATMAAAGYVADSNGVMEVQMQFTDMQLNTNGSLVPPGSLVILDMFMPLDGDGEITAGKYSVSENAGQSMTVTPGFEYGGYLYGSLIQHAPDQVWINNYLFVSGSVDISEGSNTGSYKVLCNLVTEDGISVTCTYEGPLSVSGVPVIDDFSIDLSGAVATASYYGDYYNNNGSNWLVGIGPASSGDGVQFEIVSEAADITSGIPSGTYKASASTEYLAQGEFLTGYTFSDGMYNYIVGTSYLNYDSEGYITDYALAVDGTIEIVNNGNGTYTMTFACETDRGNVWSGSWSGELAIEDESDAYSAMSLKSAKPARSTKILSSNDKTRNAVSSGFKIERVDKSNLFKSAR